MSNHYKKFKESRQEARDLAIKNHCLYWCIGYNGKEYYCYQEHKTEWSHFICKLDNNVAFQVYKDGKVKRIKK